MGKIMIKENENNNNKYFEGNSPNQYGRGLTNPYKYFANDDSTAMTESNKDNNELEYFTE